MSITPVQMYRAIGAVNLIAAVGVGAFATGEAATKDVPTKRTVQLGSAAVAMAGLGAAITLPQSSRLILPALGAAALGMATFMGIGVTNS